MHRHLKRFTLLGGAIVAVTGIPSTASAVQPQSLVFNSCVTAGVCGSLETFFTGTLLTVRISNDDASFGSALYSAQLIFADALAPAGPPGTTFSAATTALPVGIVGSIGNTLANGWSYNAVAGSNILDLASFFNVYVEGTAASPFRALAGDPNNGTWVTKNGFVEFTGDISGIAGVAGGQVTGLGFCTQVDCISGAAVVATPEPATMTLLATGMAGVAALRRRRKRNVTTG